MSTRPISATMPAEARTVLVAGGSGQVGGGIVQALVDAGHHVIVPTRSSETRAQVVERVSPDRRAQVTVEIADLSVATDAERLRARLHHRGLDPTDIVASLGGWSHGPFLIDMNPERWHETLTAGLQAHFHTARTFLPGLVARSTGVYLSINGGAALHPMPGSGAVNVSSAAQLMLTRALDAELRQTGVRARTLVADTPVITRSRPQGRPDWLTAASLGRLCAALVAGADVESTTRLEGDNHVVRMMQAFPVT